MYLDLNLFLVRQEVGKRKVLARGISLVVPHLPPCVSQQLSTTLLSTSLPLKQSVTKAPCIMHQAICNTRSLGAPPWPNFQLRGHLKSLLTWSFVPFGAEAVWYAKQHETNIYNLTLCLFGSHMNGDNRVLCTSGLKYLNVKHLFSSTL